MPLLTAYSVRRFFSSSLPSQKTIESGWHIAALTLKVFVEAGGYGDTPVLGLGNDELRWNKVVRPGDRLTVKREVVELRRSRSNPISRPLPSAAARPVRWSVETPKAAPSVTT